MFKNILFRQFFTILKSDFNNSGENWRYDVPCIFILLLEEGRDGRIKY